MERNGELIGMISKRNVLVYANKNGDGANKLDCHRLKPFQGSSRVDRFMSAPVVTMRPNESIRLAAKAMLEEGIHAVAITNGEYLFGIVTESDLLKCYSEDDIALRPPEREGELADWMSSNVHCVQAGDSCTELMRIMKEYHVRHVPVVDEQQRLVGIVSEGDVLLGGNVTKTGYHVSPESCSANSPRCAADLMSENAITLSSESTLEDAARIMVEHSLSSIPIVDKDRLVGIVTSTDLLRPLCN